MVIRKSVLVVIAALSLAVPIAAACGGSGSAEGGGEGGGETPLVTFNDAATKVSISYPSTWQKTSDQPLTFTGQDEFIAVEIRQGNSDPVAAARADEGAVRAVSPGFKLTGIAASKEVKNSAVMSYTWELGKSSVTGKAVPEQADRYYIDLGDGRIAVLTGSSPKTNFDREQVRDIALTLKVNK
jgi:hypothetical protein